MQFKRLPVQNTHISVSSGGTTYLHGDLEGHLPDGAEGGVEAPLCQVLLCYHVSDGLRHKDANFYDTHGAQIPFP